MKQKNELKTIRFRADETKRIEVYLKQNPVFESFSSLGRVATLTFIGQAGTLNLKPITEDFGKKRPSFLWDYDLSDLQVREILSQPGLGVQKKWLMAKILTQARFDETLNYLDVEEIEKGLPYLRLPQKIRERWQYALERWRKK